MNKQIDLTAPDGFQFPVYVGKPTMPDGQVPGAAIIVLQEIFGVNAHIRAVTDSFAAQGYLALAPALFHRSQAGVQLGYTPDDVASGIRLKGSIEALPAPGVLQDIQATIDYAAALCGGKVGVTGFCWGGLQSWRAAAVLKGLSASVPYYGGGMTVGQELTRSPQCPVLVHFGDRDKGIPMDTVEAFRAAQAAAGAPVEVQVYAAEHGFNCDERASFDVTAATVASERTLRFFARHLRG